MPENDGRSIMTTAPQTAVSRPPQPRSRSSKPVWEKWVYDKPRGLNSAPAEKINNNIPPSLLKVWKELDEKKQRMAATEKNTLKSRAIVARDTLGNKGWKMEEITMREIRDDELLVEVVASGVCHTDIMCGSGQEKDNPALFFYPRVLGHEGMCAVS